MKLLVGGDPEIFLKDTEKNAFVSVTEFDVPGTKTSPHKVKGGAVQKDGTALEINIDPASDPQEFSDNLQTVIQEARAFVPKNVEFVFTPVVDYEKSYFEKFIPDKAKELGCDPDYRADTGERNGMPKAEGTMRTGSGHISLGWGSGYDVHDPTHFWDCRQMSLRLNTYFTAYKGLWDTDTRRHDLYGAGAAFRPKNFGVEFRSLSNAWVGRPELYPWVFNSVKWIFDRTVAGKEAKNAIYYDFSAIEYREVLGYTEEAMTTYVYAPVKVSLKNRLDSRREFIRKFFGDADDLPEFPKDFVPAVDQIPKVYFNYKVGRTVHG